MKRLTEMKSLKYLFFFIALAGLTQNEILAQCGGSYVPDGDEFACGNPGYPCCQVSNACNGTNYPACNNYDPDYTATGGCDLSCAPIDNGVLFLLIGGGLFGGLTIMRRRETVLLPIHSK